MSAERPQSTPIGIGIPTGSSGTPRQRHCPGSMLRVSRADYLVMKRDGHVWSTGVDDIRHEGLNDARTFCSRDVAEIKVPQGKQGEKPVSAIYHSALCASCADDERDNRAALAERFGAR